MGATPGRRSRATRAAFFVTGTPRVAVQTSHLPSMRVRTAEASRPSSNGLATLYFSLIDPNRPQRTEFIRMRNAHLEPLRRNHIRTKLPVRPTNPTGPDSDHGARRMPRRDTAKRSEPNRRGVELPLR